MQQRLSPFLILLDTKYLPLLFAAAPQAFAVYQWQWRGSDAWYFAILGALAFEMVYVGAIAWTESGTFTRWTWATAFAALVFSIAVAVYVHRAQGFASALHAGFPLVGFLYTCNMHAASRRRPVAQPPHITVQALEPSQAVASLPAPVVPTFASLVDHVRKQRANDVPWSQLAAETGFAPGTLRSWVEKETAG